jgi:hypothetical protein
MRRPEPTLLGREPAVLPDGAVIVPAHAAALTVMALKAAVRAGHSHPDLVAVIEALGAGARTYRHRAAQLADLERRAASAAATAPVPAVLAFPQTGPPSDQEMAVPVVVARLGLTGQRVRQLAQAGRLAGRKVNGQWFFTETAIAEFRRNKAA